MNYKEWKNAIKEKNLWFIKLKNCKGNREWRFVFANFIYWSNDEYFWSPNRFFNVYDK